jgi:hypothetical protein
MSEEKNGNINRREFIHASMIGGLLIAVLGSGGILWIDRQLFLKSELFQLISPGSNWHSFDLLRFLEVLNLTERAGLVKSFEKDYDLHSGQILKELRRISSNILTYLFRDKFDFDYHAILQRSANKLGISQQHVDTETTFSLEARILHAMINFF